MTTVPIDVTRRRRLRDRAISVVGVLGTTALLGWYGYVTWGGSPDPTAGLVAMIAGLLVAVAWLRFPAVVAFAVGQFGVAALAVAGGTGPVSAVTVAVEATLLLTLAGEGGSPGRHLRTAGATVVMGAGMAVVGVLAFVSLDSMIGGVVVVAGVAGALTLALRDPGDAGPVT